MRCMAAFVLFLVAVQSEKLSREENEILQKTCGKGLKLHPYGRKVLNGVRARVSEAPWNVALELENGGPGLCTGTLVSPRHLVTARHCFAVMTNGGYAWMTNGSRIAGCAEESDDIVQEGNFDEMFNVFLGTDCGYRKNCKEQQFDRVRIRKIVLPRACDDKPTDFDDFAIVELSENVKFTKMVRAICVAHGEDEVFDDDPPRMKLFGYGVDPTVGEEESAGPLKYESVTLEKSKHDRKTFYSKSLSGKQMACVGDSGGGVVRMVGGRVTLVGVIYQGFVCSRDSRNEKDHVVNVAFYSDDICRYTGICAHQQKREGKTESLRKTVGKSFISLVLYSLVFR